MSFDHLESHPGVPLIQHLEGVAQRAKAFAHVLPLRLPFDAQLFAKLAWLSGYYHDIAKSTPYFQDYLHKKRSKGTLTTHALPSAVIAYIAALKECKAVEEPWRTLLPAFIFMAIRYHHGNLRPLKEAVSLVDKDKITLQQLEVVEKSLVDVLPYGAESLIEAKRMIADYPANWTLKLVKLKKSLRSLPDPSFGYLVLNSLFSCLIDADKLTTVLVEQPLPDRAKLPTNLITTNREVHEFPKHKLNPVRDAFFKELHQNAETIQPNGIHTITAPTGTGKTLSVLNAALQLRERIESEQGYRPRIIYALPFLSVIDQNAERLYKIIEKVLGEPPSTNMMLTHHHLSPRDYKADGEHDFDGAAELLVEGWNSELVITTFFQVFQTLVGGRNRNVRRYHNLLGGILILDEVQSVPTKYWTLTRHLLTQLSDYTPSLVMLSTATQPAILENARELLNDPSHYYQHDLLNRTKISYQSESQKLADFIKGLRKPLQEDVRDTLVVVNTIKDARAVFESLEKLALEHGYKSFYLTTQVTPKERLARTRKIEDTKEPVFVISTQLIEAGVDIDVSRVWRDAAPFDSILQVAGRANRHAERDEVSNIQVIEAVGENFRGSRVYDATLLDVTRHLLEQYTPLIEFDYLDVGQKYARALIETVDQGESQKHIEAIQSLDYATLDSFRLIEDDVESASIFIELDGDAQELWQRYNELNFVTDRWERRRRFNQFRADFFQYVIQIRTNTQQWKKNRPPEVNGMFYVPLLDVETYYDSKTGFRLETEIISW